MGLGRGRGFVANFRFAGSFGRIVVGGRRGTFFGDGFFVFQEDSEYKNIIYFNEMAVDLHVLKLNSHENLQRRIEIEIK